MHYLLLDAAVLREHPLLKQAQQQGARSLYLDLGADAQKVGPWLLPDWRLADVGAIELPARHGISELESDADLDTLQAHFTRIHHIETRDGQRYFLRFADMRALSSIKAALDARQWAFVCGRIERWSFVDRREHLRQLVTAPIDTPRKVVDRMRLTDRQLSTLLDASLPDQLGLAVEEMGEPGLNPATNPDQFEHLLTAAEVIRQHGIESFPVQRAIAMQSVRHGGDAVMTDSFRHAIRDSLKRAATDAIDRWAPPCLGLHS